MSGRASAVETLGGEIHGGRMENRALMAEPRRADRLYRSLTVLPA